jgi:hypothetical protein
LVNKLIFYIGKVYFWPSNYRVALVSTIELKNQKYLTIILCKPSTNGHHTPSTQVLTICHVSTLTHIWPIKTVTAGRVTGAFLPLKSRMAAGSCTLVAPTTSAQ